MNMESESSRESKETQSHMIVAIEEIASNVIAFCRSVVSKSGICYGKAHSWHSNNCSSDENLFVGKNFFDLKVEKNVESVMV